MRLCPATRLSPSLRPLASAMRYQKFEIARDLLGDALQRVAALHRVARRRVLVGQPVDGVVAGVEVGVLGLGRGAVLEQARARLGLVVGDRGGVIDAARAVVRHVAHLDAAEVVVARMRAGDVGVAVADRVALRDLALHVRCIQNVARLAVDDVGLQQVLALVVLQVGFPVGAGARLIQLRRLARAVEPDIGELRVRIRRRRRTARHRRVHQIVHHVAALVLAAIGAAAQVVVVVRRHPRPRTLVHTAHDAPVREHRVRRVQSYRVVGRVLRVHHRRRRVVLLVMQHTAHQVVLRRRLLVAAAAREHDVRLGLVAVQRVEIGVRLRRRRRRRALASVVVADRRAVRALDDRADHFDGRKIRLGLRVSEY